MTAAPPQAPERQAGDWAAYLADAPVGLELPQDLPQPAIRSFLEARRPLDLDPSLPTLIADLAGRLGTTPAGVWLAALQALLHRYTGETDLLVGAPAPGTVDAVLPWRVDLADNPAFRSLVDRVERARLTLERLGSLEVERYAAILHGGAAPTGAPLFQVGFVADEATTTREATTGPATTGPATTSAGPATTAGEAALARWVANTDLTLVLADGDHAGGAELAYNRDRFEPATVDRLALHLRTLLRSAVADPDRRVSELQLLEPAERHQILVEWNGESRDSPGEKFYFQYFEEQAASTPSAVAVVEGELRLTYQQLNARANQLAHRLIELGAAPGTRVGVGLERSAANIVAVLATLKSGACAVMLDPMNPRSRLGFMLADAEPVALVTREVLLDRFPGSERLPAVCLDRDQEPLQARPAGNPPVPDITQDSISHVFYTSGSTGEPKGVLMRHRGITNLAVWSPRSFEITAADRSSWGSSPGFGISLMEWPAFLIRGGTVHVAGRDVSASAERFHDWLLEHRITFTVMVGSLAARVWAMPWPKDTALRIMVTAGELVREWPPADVPFEIVVAYGSTESGAGTITYDKVAGIYATPKAFSAHERARRPAPPPVGRPTINSRVYVLDRYGNPVPPGVIGEVYTASDFMSAGYLNRPQLMPGKFVANQLPEEPNGTLVYVGDLARWGHDGLLQVLGRADGQVKIRGFRIEVGEIETALAEQPGVGEVVVVARDDVAGGRGLVAYIVQVPDSGLSPRQLRRALQARLPYYMVPAAFAVLEELPRLPSGKLDRRGLPAPVLTRAVLEEELAPPRDQTEERLADIWSELLLIEEVGVKDSFFDLGGHSLLATELLARLGHEFGVGLELTEFSEEPTIAEVARRIEASRAR